MPSCVVLIAHDAKNDALVQWAQTYQSILARYHLISPDKTGLRIQLATGLEVECVPSIQAGGDLLISARILADEVVGVIFLRDPVQGNQNDPTLHSIIRACEICDIPLATNLATAELAIRGVAKSRVAYLIFNPISGQGNPDRDLALIRQILEPQVNLHTIFTQSDIDPVDQAKEAIATLQALQLNDPDGDHEGLIIASGGDGTVSAIASATIGTGIPLGVIPRGTANAFSVALGIPTNMRLACETIAAGNTRMVDSARCNHIPMILLAGLGFEAGMVGKAGRDLKNRLGTLAYVLSGAQQLFEQEPFNTTLEINGEVLELETGAVTVANAAPPTSVLAQGFGEVIPDDGLLEVTISTSKSMMQRVNTFASLFTSALVKTQFNRDDLICLRTHHLKITTDPPQKLVIDGEIIEANPVEFECIPKSLILFTPLSTL